MPSCTEVALLRLKPARTQEDLAEDAAHKQALEILSRQPGFLSCTWGILMEDSTMLVWLVEWETIEDHTERWMKSPEYGPFADLIFTLLDQDQSKAIVSMTHAFFASSPASLPSPERPVLEVFQMQLPSADKSEHENLVRLFKPITDQWDSQGRRWVVAPLVDDGKRDHHMLIAAWESKERHYESKKEQYYQDAIGKARGKWVNVALFGHIKASVVRA